MTIRLGTFAVCAALATTVAMSAVPGPPATVPAASAEAEYQAGLASDLGRGVRQDYAEAVRHYRRAAELGHAGAQFALAEMYKNGDGIAKDIDQALHWYRAAAAQGEAGAELMLGVLYESGVGVTVDLAEAARWYRRSADHGDARAQLLLGVLYQTGQGVRWDPVAAWALYAVSANRDHAPANPAPGHRAMLEPQMTPLQLAQAHSLAEAMSSPTGFRAALDRYLAGAAPAGGGR